MIESSFYYSWTVLLRDGTTYNSGFLNANNRGGYDQLEEHDKHGKIVAFSLVQHYHVERATPDGLNLDLAERPVFTMHLDPGERLIYRTRIETRSVFGSEVALERGNQLILVGARKRVGEETVQRLFWIFESNGEIHCTPGFREKDRWFYSPIIRPYEVPR